MLVEIKPYTPENLEAWNNFIAEADNSNFLFNRNFMDYHSDRFTDCSVMLFEENILTGVFRANKIDNTVYSHQGLTYGGLILRERRNEKKLLLYYYELFKYYLTNGSTEIVYKPIPNYISKTVNDLEHFILNMLKAEVIKVDTAFILDCTSELKFQERRKRSIKKGIKANTEVRYDNDLEGFWNKILEPNLRDKFSTKPVHSLAEIKLLHERFPEKIKQANAYINNEIVAGVTLFEFDTIVHCQYISSNDFGRDSGAIDLLFENLINIYKEKTTYFSLGTANNEGNDLNLGLCDWKEGWGSKIWAHFHYKFSLGDLKNIERFTL